MAAGVATLWSPADPWLSSVPVHPAWLAIIVLTARYGRRGLIVAAPLAWAVVGLGAGVVGAGLAGVARLASLGDLMALGATVLVAAVASLHQHRQTELRRELKELDQRARAESEAVGAMREALAALRDRNDRIDLSLSFWRDIAARVQSGDVTDAAKAALQLAMVRTGARAGIIRRIDGSRVHTLAWRGAWEASQPIPRDIFPDRTIAAAIEERALKTATELDDPAIDDSDVATPIIHGDELLGVLALRGVRASRLGAGVRREVDIIAGWVAPALAREAETPRTHAGASVAPEPAAEPEALPLMAAVAGGGAVVQVASGSGSLAAERPDDGQIARVLPFRAVPPAARATDDPKRERLATGKVLPAIPEPPPKARTLARRKGGAPRGRRRTHDPNDTNKPRRSTIWG